MNEAGRLKCGIVLLFLSAGIQAATGAAILFNLPNAHPRLAAFTLEIHEWNGPVFITLIVIHIASNWWWFKGQLLRRAAAPGIGDQQRLRRSQPGEGG